MSASAALSLAESGLFVFPVWEVTDGRCACGGQKTCNEAKHPRLPWKKNATSDPATVKYWWKKWPNANIGIATGPSRLAVIDVDPRNGGNESFESLIQVCTDLEASVPKVRTGGGGFHLYFKQPESGDVPSTNGKIPPWRGIDTRGDTGYIIAPPSSHISGEQYRWIRPLEFPLKPFPANLREMLLSRQSDASIRKRSGTSLTDLFKGTRIKEGGRNESFASFAGTLRTAGLPADINFQFLLWLRSQGYAENQESFPDDEIASIVSQSYKYDRIALYAHLDSWMKSGVNGSTFKYLAAVALDKGRHIANPSVKRIALVSGLSEKTQYRCRKAAVSKDLIRVVDGHKERGPAEISFTIPMSQTVGSSDIMKTGKCDVMDRSFLSEEKNSHLKGSPSGNRAAVVANRPNATAIQIFSRPRQSRGNVRTPGACFGLGINSSNPASETK